MATKKELLQAQNYSRRRLVTTFVSGIPGGKELEPTKPMRAVISGVALSVILIVGSLIFGLINPSLPDGWDDNTLLIAKESGARYVTIKGTLYPVINTTSARLLIPASSFQIISVDDNYIADAPRGETIGILGAPDALPNSDRLTSETWSACLAAPSFDSGPATIATIINPDQSAAEHVDRAIIVSVHEVPYLVANGHRYKINRGESAGILRALDLADQPIKPVTAQWLQLFPPGTDLDPLTIDRAGERAPDGIEIDGRPPKIGTIIRIAGKTSDSPYVLTADGKLAKLTPFAYALFSVRSDIEIESIEVADSEIGALGNARFSVMPTDWPSQIPQALEPDREACAVMNSRPGGTGVAKLAATVPSNPDIPEPYRAESGLIVEGTYVSAGSGALIRAIASGDGVIVQGTELDYALDRGNAFLIDETGTLFPLPGADVELLNQLEYTRADVFDVPSAWAALFPVGPALTAQAAGNPPAVTGPIDQVD